MASININITGSYEPTGYSSLDKKLDKISAKLFKKISEGLTEKAKDNASGAELPQIAPDQGPNIGKSDSGGQLTGVLKDGISLTIQNESGDNFKALIESKAEYSSFVESGTGVRGEKKSGLIYPKNARFLKFKIRGQEIIVPYILGQQPKPFMRGAIWWVKENWKEVIE